MIRLIRDRIAVRPIYDREVHRKDPSGGKVVLADGEVAEFKHTSEIWVPETAQERVDQGIVKYVGPNVKDHKIGDYVIFSGYTGTLVFIEDEGPLIIMREKFVICKVNPDPIIVPGLYYRDRDGTYFSATYESIFNILAETITDKNLALNVKSEKPRLEDYNDDEDTWEVEDDTD